MRRWQYSKAFSRSCSWGGSRRLAEEAADSTDRVEPSSSDLSSEKVREGAQRGEGQAAYAEAARPGAAERATTGDTRGAGPTAPSRQPATFPATGLSQSSGGLFAEEELGARPELSEPLDSSDMCGRACRGHESQPS